MVKPPYDNASLLCYWITEREEMRKRKESGDKFPYSKDPLMATIRYCNVRREDDKVTRWIKENWRNLYFAHQNLPVAMTLARMVNWPDTLAEIEWPNKWDGHYEERVINVLRSRKGRGEKTWSSAYMITTCGRQMSKEHYVVQHVCRAVARVCASGLLAPWNSLESTAKYLGKIDGLGTFLTGQVLADLKNTPGHPLHVVDDWLDWSAPGPGSLRGLSALYERDVKEMEYEALISAAWDAIGNRLPPELRDLHMQDFQNCLCEFSKFMRARAGTGHARNNYRGL